MCKSLWDWCEGLRIILNLFSNIQVSMKYQGLRLFADKAYFSTNWKKTLDLCHRICVKIWESNDAELAFWKWNHSMYDEVDEFMLLTKPHEINITQGDFNTTVGREIVWGIAGHYDLGDRNEKGID